MERTRHLGYIEALRGIAVAAVIVTHVANGAHLPAIEAQLLALAAKGVQLFYVISAFTLMLSMNKRTHSEQYPTVNFFIRRVFRIAPAFYLVLALYCLLGWIASRSTGIEPTSLPHAVLIMSFLNGWRPDVINSPVTGQWSIAVEMTFYLLLPLIFPLLSTFRRAVFAWFISLGIYIASYPLASHLATAEGATNLDQIKDFAYWWFPSQLPIFMCGIGVYFIVQKKLPLLRSTLPYLGGALAVAICHRFYSDIGLLPLVGVAIMIGVSLLSRWPIPFLVNPLTRFLGNVSFSAYLCHPLILIAVVFAVGSVHLQNANGIFLLTCALVFVLVCPVAYLMWVIVEQPCQRLGRSLIAAREGLDKNP